MLFRLDYLRQVRFLVAFVEWLLCPLSSFRVVYYFGFDVGPVEFIRGL